MLTITGWFAVVVIPVRTVRRGIGTDGVTTRSGNVNVE